MHNGWPTVAFAEGVTMMGFTDVHGTEEPWTKAAWTIMQAPEHNASARMRRITQCAARGIRPAFESD